MQQPHQLPPEDRPCRQEQPPAGQPDLPWPDAQQHVRGREYHRIAARCLDPGPQSPKAARDFTAETLRRWDLPTLSQDAAVIVSELVTNALRHGTRGDTNDRATGRVELILWRRAGHLVCAVTDEAGAQPPAPAPPSLSAEAGWGLPLVEALASTWGWARLDSRRKAVWAALPIPETGTQTATRDPIPPAEHQG